MGAQISTIFTAMLPIAELRGAIPLALGFYHLPIWQAYFFSVLGNIIPVFLLLWFWPNFSSILMRHSKFFNKVFIWLFKRTKDKHTKKFERWGALALIAFVAIPLPITGAWTGSVAAFVFGVPYWKALGLILAGVLIAGVIVTLVSTGTISFLKIV